MLNRAYLFVSDANTHNSLFAAFNVISNSGIEIKDILWILIE